MITCLWIFAYFLGIDIRDHGKNTCMITIACKERTVIVGRETGKHLKLLKTQHYKTMTHGDAHLQDQRVNCRMDLNYYGQNPIPGKRQRSTYYIPPKLPGLMK